MKKIIALVYEIEIDTEMEDDDSILKTIDRHMPSKNSIHGSMPFFNGENIKVFKSLKIRNK